MLLLAFWGFMSHLIALTNGDEAPRARDDSGDENDEGRTQAVGVFVYLTDGAPTRVAALHRSLRALDTAFNGRARYPVVVFYDTGVSAVVLTAAQQNDLSHASAGTLTCEGIDMEAAAPAAALAAAPEVITMGDGNSFSMGYRLMANFFAGSIADAPALSRYAYYWRLDTDSQLLAPVPGDPFADMAKNSWSYGWAATQCDWHLLTEGLYAAISAAAPLGGQVPSALLPTAFSDDSCPRGPAPRTPYNNRIFYNNFELVELAWLRTPAYRRLYKAAADGILSRRWGDAPIRTLAALVLLPPEARHHFDDLSYAHQAGITEGLFGAIVFDLVSAVAAAGVCFCAAAVTTAVVTSDGPWRARKLRPVASAP